jgi:hypothetical protein
MRGLHSVTLEPSRVVATSTLPFDGNVVVIVVGLLFLIVISVAVGMSLDTEHQYRSADAAAEEIRRLNEKKRELVELNHRIWKAIQILADRYATLKKETALRKRCLKCPFRDEDSDE